MHQKRIAKAYLTELGGSLLLYTALVIIASYAGRLMEDGMARTLVLVSPMIGFGLALWAIARHFARVDEYIRRLLLESVALAAAITAGLTFTYGFLETAGFPRLSMFVVWCLLCGTTGLVCCVRRVLGK